MPYAHIKKLIPRSLDRRVKISEMTKELIKSLHKNNKSLRSISLSTGVSRRSVQFILFPERLQIVRQQFKERRKDGRYKPSKTQWARTMREHRYYKESIKNTLIDKTLAEIEKKS